MGALESSIQPCSSEPKTASKCQKLHAELGILHPTGAPSSMWHRMSDNLPNHTLFFASGSIVICISGRILAVVVHSLVAEEYRMMYLGEEQTSVRSIGWRDDVRFIQSLRCFVRLCRAVLTSPRTSRTDEYVPSNEARKSHGGQPSETVSQLGSCGCTS